MHPSSKTRAVQKWYDGGTDDHTPTPPHTTHCSEGQDRTSFARMNDVLQLKDTQAEQTSWQTFFAKPLRDELADTADVKVLLSAGLLILVNGEEQTALQIGHCDTYSNGYIRIGETVLRYIGQELSDAGGRCVDILSNRIHDIYDDPEQSQQWEQYIRWASMQPSRAYALHQEGSTYQGEELLIRLLEPCQAKCSFCICRSGQPDLVSSLHDVQDRLREGRELGRETVVFTGGEPTLVKELPDLIALAKTLGYLTIGLQTNGIKLADRHYTQTLKDAGLTRILQSLHSHDPATHETIFKIEDCFDTCVSGVQSAIAVGLRVTLNFVTTPLNIDHHTAYVEFVHRSFRRKRTLKNLLASPHPSITFSVMSPQGWGAQHEQQLGQLTDIAKSVGHALDRAKQLRMDVRVPGLCGFPPCLLPNHAHHFDELFEERPVRIPTRTLFDGCHGCAYEPRCSGYWRGYVDQHGVGEFVPVPKPTPFPRRRSRRR